MEFSDWVWRLVCSQTSLVGSSQSLEDSEQQQLRPPGKRMRPSRALVLGILALTTVLSPCGGEFDVKADHIGSYGLSFYQSHQPNGQYTFEFDGDELFYVDSDKKETVWRIPEFGQLTSFDPQGGLQTIAVAKQSLNVMIQRTNSTPATNKVPEVTVFPKAPVLLGQPNTLICFVDKIFPPVVNITWLRNSKSVTEGVYETSFFVNRDYSFHRMSYLTFIPSDDEVYDCKVEHWGLEEPVLKHWEPEIPAPMSELTETVVCALGLSMGIVGIVVGTIFIIQGLRSGGSSRHPGPL